MRWKVARRQAPFVLSPEPSKTAHSRFHKDRCRRLRFIGESANEPNQLVPQHQFRGPATLARPQLSMENLRYYAPRSEDYPRWLRLRVLFFAVRRTGARLTDDLFLAGFATVSSSLAVALVGQVLAGSSKNMSRLLNLRVPGLK